MAATTTTTKASTMTTERILPAIAGTRPVARAGTPAARPATAHRNQPFLTMPARAGILLGTSAAVYALSLAAVATFQAADDRAVAAGRQPYLDAIAESRSAGDSLEATLVGIDARARAIDRQWTDASSDIAAYEANLDELAALVAEVQGSTSALPSRIKLPSVSIHGAVASGGSRARPSTTTTTRASGH